MRAANRITMAEFKALCNPTPRKAMGLSARKAKKTPKRAIAFVSHFVSGGDDWIDAQLPIRLVTLENLREHWTAKAERARQHIETVRLALGCVFHRTTTNRLRFLALYSTDNGVRVTLTRLGPRTLDSGNFQGCFKHVQDGVARWLGIDDADDRVEWIYQQEKSAAYGVRIRIEPKRAEGA